MKLSINDLPEEIKRRNPHLFPCVGSVEAEKPEPTLAQTLDSRPQKQSDGKKGVVVSLLVFTRRELDSDNLQGACKPLRDAIATTLQIDDGDKRIRWQYSQIETKGEEGVLIKIETI